MTTKKINKIKQSQSKKTKREKLKRKEMKQYQGGGWLKGKKMEINNQK